MKRYLIKNMCFSPWGTPHAARRAKAPTNELSRRIAGIDVSRIQTAGLPIAELVYERHKAQFEKAKDDGLIDIILIALPGEEPEAEPEPVEPVEELEPEVEPEETTEEPVESVEEPEAEEPTEEPEPTPEEPKPSRRGRRK